MDGAVSFAEVRRLLRVARWVYKVCRVILQVLRKL